MNTGYNIDNEVYKSELTSHIKGLINNSTNSINLFDIIVNSEGASPILVKEILDTNNLKYTLDNKVALVNQNYSVAKTIGFLSDPHPADYDWRFNQNTINIYVQDIINESVNSKIALLGTKTIFKGLIDNSIDTTIFNKSKSILNNFRENGYTKGLIHCDLFEPQTDYNNIFNLVIADPPWYEEYYNTFIQRSSDFLTIGGKLHLSVLQKMTRPNAIVDREKIIQNATKFGLKLIKIIPKYFVYETPNFERNTLKIQNLQCENWRISDLFIFEKVSSEINNEVILPLFDEPMWQEYNIGSKKIKIKNVISQVDNQIFSFESADPNGIIFTDVSRRSPFRKRIDVWTSDNLAFRVKRQNILNFLFNRLSLGVTGSECIALLSSEYILSEEEIVNLNEFLNHFQI